MERLLCWHGVYWPTILKDCIEFSRGCQECQKHGGIQHVPADELHSIIKPYPFRGWALDLIGEIKHVSFKSHRYVLVGIDYFTKWVGEIPLTNIDQHIVIDFIHSQIMCRYGTPETITTGQGSVFFGRKVIEFSAETRIKFLTSTPEWNYKLHSSSFLLTPQSGFWYDGASGQSVG